MTHEKAIQYLTDRYKTQCYNFPITSKYVSLDAYIKANLPFVLRRNLGQSSKPSHHATVLP